jgi:thiamine biosynthesis protein ThiS
MQLIVNGRVCHVPAATLADLLEHYLSQQPGFEGRTRLTVGTAHNGIFVPRERRRHCQLSPGDRVDILVPGQGG